MYRVFFLLLLPILLFSKYHVTTYFPLETFLVKQIGQNHLRVKEISNLYTSTFQKLDYKNTSRFSSSEAFFNFGLDVEKKYAKVLKKANANLIIVDMSKGITKLTYNKKENPYIWMDPLLVREIAKNIYNSLLIIDKFNKESYLLNYKNFLKKLDDAFLKTKQKLDKSDIYNIFVYDEHWDYFANRFGLNLYRKEKKYVKSNELKTINSFIKKNEIKALLIAPHDSFAIAKSLSVNANIKLKTHDIFEEIYFYNISSLTSELSN